MENGIPTIKEIAKRLNISPSTVSRALHDHPRIGLRTRMQVQQLAKELNYEPNQLAIRFKQKRTFTLGLILPNLSEEFFSLAINGIEDTALKNNYNVLIGQSHDELELEKRIVKTMYDHRVDGILASISKNTSDIAHFRQLDKYNIPVVFFDRVPDVPEIHSVWCSLYNSTIKAVDLLFERGHERIGFIDGPLSLNIRNERMEGYCAAHKKKAIPVNEAFIVRTDFSSKGTFAAMDQLLSLRQKPTAIVAFNDNIALDAIQYVKKKKLKHAHGISFVSYANWHITDYLDNRPLASIEQFPYKQGSMATELLLKLLTAGSPAPGSASYNAIQLKSKLIVYSKQ